MKLSKHLTAYAGPNGSGKSTTKDKLGVTGEYINADDIKKEFNLSDLEAAKIAEFKREIALFEGRDFTFETVLSTNRNLDLIKRAKEKNYFIKGIFVLTCDPMINVMRVYRRVLVGGHDVPKDKIISRYYKSLENIKEMKKYCDEFYIIDNTYLDGSIIYSSIQGVEEYSPSKEFNLERIKELTK